MKLMESRLSVWTRTASKSDGRDIWKFESRPRNAGFFWPNNFSILNLFFRMLDSLISACLNSFQAERNTGPAAKAAPLFNSQRNKQQTALPLPATGEQTGPKACQRQEHPGRLIDGETPKPCE
jgi:hypothetical protein